MVNFKKFFLSAVLSVTLLTTSISPYLASVKDVEVQKHETKTIANLVLSTTPTDRQTKVRPDTNITITLKATKELLKELGLSKENKIESGTQQEVYKEVYKDEDDLTQGKNREEIKGEKDKIGVLIRSNKGDFLATQSNQNLNISYNAANNTIEITLNHPLFDRYTKYDTYLLTKEALHKYESYLKSKKHSESFQKMIEKENSEHYYKFSFETGSAIGEARNWQFEQNKTGKVLTTEDVVITAKAYDDYDNSATEGALIFTGAVDKQGTPVEGIIAEPVQAQLNDGSAEIHIKSSKTQDVVLNFETQGTYPEDKTNYKAEVYFVKPAPEGSKVDIKVKKLDNDTYELDGTVMLNNQPVTEVGMPLLVENGTVSDNLPVTDATGHFKVEVAKTDVTKAVAVSVDTAKAPGVTMPMVGIDPIIFGNQAWTDTGIDITTPNMLIRIAATGTWANNLYAKVGTNGTPVKVGANGGYVTGVTGRLYLGPYNATYEDNVDAIIYLDNPKDIGIYPTMSLTANPTQLPADGKSTSTISGQVLYGQYPLVDGTVNLTATLGTLSTTAPTTDVTGKYTAMFTSGTTAGTAVINSSFDNLNQSVSITLSQPVVNLLNVKIIPAHVGLSNVKKVLSYSKFALENNGTVWTWKSASYGEQKAVQITGITDVKDIETLISYNRDLVVALKNDGTVWEIERKFDGKDDKFIVRQINKLSDVESIYTGPSIVFAVKKDGTVWAFGDNSYGGFGNGEKTTSYSFSYEPVQVKNLSNVKNIAASSSTIFAVTNDGKVYVWGITSYYPRQIITIPTRVDITNVDNVYTNAWDAYALKKDGTVWRLAPEGKIVPYQIQGLDNVVRMYALFNNRAFVVKSDGSVWGWGDNTKGQLGNGTTGSYKTDYIPVQVKGLKNVVSMGDCGSYLVAVKDDGTVWTWGGYYNEGSFKLYTTPVQIEGMTDAVKVERTYIIRADGTVWYFNSDFTLKQIQEAE